MTATSFFESLAAAFQVRKVVEGENFHFGKDRQAGRKALTGLCSAIGASLETADTVYYKNLPVSSTRIRHAVRAGRMEDVRKMISGAYPLDLPAAAVKRDREGRAVIDTGDLIQAVPAQGCYHCRADSGSETEETEVVVAKERIFIRSNLPSVKTLYFEKKIDRTFARL
jgi:FAD synthase